MVAYAIKRTKRQQKKSKQSDQEEMQMEKRNMHNTVPIWFKYTLTVEEAAIYFRIGENKLRNLINENKNANYLLWNGNRVQIKRVQFEHFIDGLETI